MELILVRHGQPAWATPDGRGRNDPGLTDLGHAQAERVGRRLADATDLPAPDGVDHVFVSPAVRAQETAVPIGEALQMDLQTLDWLWELRNPPAWEGVPIEEIEQQFAALAAKDRETWWGGHEGGESLRDFHQRVTTGLRSLLAGFGITPSAERGLWDLDPSTPARPRRVVAVAHGGTNSTIIANLLGAEPEPWEWDRFAMGHASVALLALTPMAGHHIWSLRALGDANHLAVDDRTY